MQPGLTILNDDQTLLTFADHAKQLTIVKHHGTLLSFETVTEHYEPW